MMETIYVLLVVLDVGHGAASGQLNFQSMEDCKKARVEMLTEWNTGKFKDGYSGYMSAICHEAKR